MKKNNGAEASLVKEKFMVVGGGGRESVFAEKLCEDVSVYAVIGHANPTIISCVLSSGGRYLIDDPNDPKVVLDFAKLHDVDYVFINADEPLSKGVVDLLLANQVKAIGGTKEATRIEWDKVYAMDMVNQTSLEHTPFYQVESSPEGVEQAIEEFQRRSMEVVVKPQGLTGGKGVKVMPIHLSTYQDAKDYALFLLKSRPKERVLLVEKIEGIEFTIMGFTDGDSLLLSPATYDYPFRLEGDTGAGTGGMGCFTAQGGLLPFLSADDLEACRRVMQRIIDQLKKTGVNFSGVLNAGFFITKQGIKFMEFNSRFGDPEGINVLMLLKGSFSELLKRIWHKTLSHQPVEFLEKTSVVKYLVAKEYPDASCDSIRFSVDHKGLNEMGMRLFFSSCVQEENSYVTLRKSRVAAIGNVSQSIERSSEKINEAIDRYITGDLEYRKDIGSKENLEILRRFSEDMQQ